MDKNFEKNIFKKLPVSDFNCDFDDDCDCNIDCDINDKFSDTKRFSF